MEELREEVGERESLTSQSGLIIIIIIIINPVTRSVVGAPTMTLKPAVSTSSCRLPPFVSLGSTGLSTL